MISFTTSRISLLLAGVLLACAGCSDTMTDPATTGFDSIEQTTHTLVNQHRQTMGLAPLTFDSRIASIARQHSANMASESVGFGHDGFDSRTDQIGQLMTVTATAENVAFNKGFDDNPGAKAVEDWLNSSGHRANIEGSYTLTGIGVAKASDGSYYFTQIFVQQ